MPENTNSVEAPSASFEEIYPQSQIDHDNIVTKLTDAGYEFRSEVRDRAPVYAMRHGGRSTVENPYFSIVNRLCAQEGVTEVKAIAAWRDGDKVPNRYSLFTLSI